MDYGLDREFFGMTLGLERIESVLKDLGNPEKSFPSIHIAGTNGKGSTAAMIASILREAGYRVGLYTSPHLMDIRERFQINGEMIEEDLFGELMAMVRHCEERSDAAISRLIPGDSSPAAQNDKRLSYFEFLTAVGFLYFARQKVDIAVIEVGLGGRLDATNVITPLVSVITNISLEHTQHLGDTIEKIAFEKAGIIKPGVPIVCGVEDEGALRVIKEVALNNNTVVCDPAEDSPARHPSLSLLGAHQQKNAALAAQVVQILNAQGQFKISKEALERGLQHVRWPGRLQYIELETRGGSATVLCGVAELVRDSQSHRRTVPRQDPLSRYLLDGAHNPAAMRSLSAYLKENHANDRIRLILGMMADKEVRANLEEILPIASEIIVTAPPMKRAMKPEALAEIVKEMTDKPVRVVENVSDALDCRGDPAWSPEKGQAHRPAPTLHVVTGSLYLVGEVLKILKTIKKPRDFRSAVFCIPNL